MMDGFLGVVLTTIIGSICAGVIVFVAVYVILAVSCAKYAC